MRTRRAVHSRTGRRRRKERIKRGLRRALITVGVIVLGFMAMAPPLRAYLSEMTAQSLRSIRVFAAGKAAQTEIELEERQVSALQLGVFDSGARAQSELDRLREEGVLCVIWQRDQMRLICDVEMARSALSTAAAQGRDAWIASETLPGVVMLVSADAKSLNAVRGMLTLPDALLTRLCAEDEALESLLAEAKAAAEAALDVYPEHLLYAQLAQSLSNWCALMEGMIQQHPMEIAQAYARATMYTLCYELRQALIAQNDQQLASTASAQRMPSAAAEVMPPA